MTSSAGVMGLLGGNRGFRLLWTARTMSFLGDSLTLVALMLYVADTTGLAWAVAAAFVVQTTRGLGIAAMDVAANTLIQRTVPAAMLGRVFGSLYGAIGIATALALRRAARVEPPNPSA